VLRARPGTGRTWRSYQSLAADALKLRGANDPRTKFYGDRMVAILADRPRFQDLRHGNCDAPEPAAVVKVLSDAGRKNDLDELIKKFDGQPKIDLLLGVVEARVCTGDMDGARQAIDDQLRALAPTPAARLKGALAGRVTTLPAAATVPTVVRRDRFGRPHSVRGELDSAEKRLRNVLVEIARAHARRGEVDLAARQWITLQADDISHPGGDGELASYEWAELADDAWDAGHTDAARAAYEHALTVMQRDGTLTPEHYTEKARFVREALDVGAEDLAYELMETTAQPEAWGRQVLAAAYRKRGDGKRADALITEALAMVRDDGDDSRGSTLADIATDLHAAGQTKRAEKILLDAPDHIRGEDFGFEGTHAVVVAAIRMNRLDLLDRIYAKGTASQKLLLCIVASDVAMGDDAAEENDK
jgi:tetratricopeptide (TPR) repeat protein